MLIIKAWFHFSSMLRKLAYRVIYGKRFCCGAKTHWRRHFALLITPGAKVVIGREVFFNNDCTLSAMQSIDIGDGTLFGENVKIYDNNHRFRDRGQLVKDQGFHISPVHIGSNCWIGSNAVILKGANIGDNCIIGAGVVVDFAVPDNTMVKTSGQYEITSLS